MRTGIAQSTGENSQSTSGADRALDSGSAPPPNDGSSLILLMIQDPEVLMFYYNNLDLQLPNPPETSE